MITDRRSMTADYGTGGCLISGTARREPRPTNLPLRSKSERRVAAPMRQRRKIGYRLLQRRAKRGAVELRNKIV
jgi:hypothetical protein